MAVTTMTTQPIQNTTTAMLLGAVFATWIFIADQSGIIVMPVFAYELSNDPNDVHFFLFPDPSNPNSTDEIIYEDEESLQTSRLKPGLRTVFITHGFRSNVTSAMCQTLKNAFLASGLNYNVIVVSWGKLATPLPPELTASLYKLATYNVPLVAERLAEFVLFLQGAGAVRIQDCYLIGHSLGAHVSGLAGRNIFGKTGENIPTITGLDPAANGGYEQTNCREVDHTAHDKLGRCSHWFAYELYAASLFKRYPSCPCSPFKKLHAAGLCTTKFQNTVMLGYYSDPTSRGEFYLETSNPP